MTLMNLRPLLDLEPSEHEDRALGEVIEGLRARPRRLPSKYFYDATGSQLFDKICELPEYYLTRTELRIMRASLDEMARCIGPHATVIEIGSGSGIKTELLLAALEQPAAYIPVDIAREPLLASAERLAERYSGLEISPVRADFLDSLRLPDWLARDGSGRRLVYFPGSTLGNLEPRESTALLRRFAQLVCEQADDDADRPKGGLLLGVDLRKDPAVLERAYNDSAGVTAAFNRNLLSHLNQRLGATIPVDAFEHAAPYDGEHHRIEMRLVARRDVQWRIGDERFCIRQGEWIVTEYSHKYALADLTERLDEAGWKVERVWTDPLDYFAVIYCECANHP